VLDDLFWISSGGPKDGNSFFNHFINWVAPCDMVIWAPSGLGQNISHVAQTT
jgi:hypothetical protein